MYHNENIDVRIKYTRMWTYEAFVKLLSQRDFNSITISDIIKKAGISRATFYRNFDSKEDIIRKQVFQFFAEFQEDMSVYVEQFIEGNDAFLIQSFFNQFNKHEELVEVVIQTKQEYIMEEGILELIQNHKDHFYQFIKTNKKTEEYIMEIVAASAWRVLVRWHKSGKEESPKQLAKIFLNAYRSVYIALFDDKNKL